MDQLNQDPKNLTDPQLDSAIAWLAQRGRDDTAVNFRREKLNRAYQTALRVRMETDPTLANTSQVVLS